KKAGFKVAQIRSLINGAAPDAPRLVAAQLDVLRLQRQQLDTAIKLLEHAQSSLDRGEEVDAATLCEIIRSGERAMQDEQWKKVIDRYYTPEEQAHWRKVKKEELGDFDQAAYTKAWADLAARIEAAMPLDPASDEAQGFLAEWSKLLEPFLKVATPEMKAGAKGMWSRIEEWEHEVDSPISSKVAKFMAQAAAARQP
ncbi:MAG TPA: TipAS antibiotic-recognition domain-containing protein, partial [Parvularculaceae bacterium]|nr:TipAS antibiotic-recognition domain-containing protein [Parvularculaceae bacterium]